jgi:hypothetical protein
MRPSPTDARGTALFATMGALLVLAVLAGSLASYARHQALLTHRAGSGEAAHQLALAGVAAALARLAAADPAPDVGELLAGLARGGSGGTIAISSDEKDSALGALVARCDAVEAAHVRATATLLDWKPIYPPGFRSPAGALCDPAERHGVIRVVARARHAGVEREVECVKAAKIIRPVLPVLPRFTLFAKTAPALADLNRMEVEKRIIYPRPAGRVRAAATHDALVLANGRAYASGGVAAGALDAAGWVFLGGEERWMFQLAFGGGDGADAEPLGDGFVLPRQAMRMSGEPEAEAVLSPEGQELMRSTFGMVRIKTGLFTGVEKDSRLFLRYPFEDPVRCASLALYGSAARPSPTLVLGRAYRRLLVYSYLTNPLSEPEVTRTFFLSHIPVDGPDRLADFRALFRFGEPPFDEDTVIATLFSGSVASYEPFGSTVLEEPYARSFDHLEKNLTGPADPDAFDPPPVLSGPERLTRALEPLEEDRGRWRRWCYDPEATSRVRLLDARRAVYFEGDLNRFATADLLLPERATYVFGRAQLAAWTAEGRLAVRGIMVFDPREGELVLDRPLTIVEGGVLVARGDIRIRAPIAAAPGTALPLALVSLEGRIVIETDRVDAQLVALSAGGAVTREGEGPLAISGGIAATALDVPALSRGAAPARVTKTLAWDDRADPARRAELPLRLYLDTRRTVTLR